MSLTNEFIEVAMPDILSGPEGTYYTRTTPNEQWIETEVYMCGDEHGDEIGFTRRGDPRTYYINEINASSFQWAKRRSEGRFQSPLSIEGPPINCVELIIFDNDGPEGIFRRLRFERSHQAIAHIVREFKPDELPSYNFELTWRQSYPR